MPGILVQLPQPAHIDVRRVLEAIDVNKGVDCFHLYNVGALATVVRCYGGVNLGAGGLVRAHRHRYFGVLAPNSPLRAAVTAMAQGNAVQAQAETVPPKRSPEHYLWAVLIARIYEVFPLLCPMCGGQMRRWMAGRKSPRIGIWRRKPHLTTRSISASTGEKTKRRF